jgi:hypothetical protein
VKRRRLVAGLAGLLILAPASVPLFRTLARRSRLAGLEPAELNAVIGEEAVDRIGASLAVSDGTGLNAEHLADELRSTAESRHGGSGILGGESFPAIVESDFRNGKIVIVDGWILSRTEARQSQLQSLIDR